jgi:hypothetical protein
MPPIALLLWPDKSSHFPSFICFFSSSFKSMYYELDPQLTHMIGLGLAHHIKWLGLQPTQSTRPSLDSRPKQPNP